MYVLWLLCLVLVLLWHELNEQPEMLLQAYPISIYSFDSIQCHILLVIF